MGGHGQNCPYGLLVHETLESAMNWADFLDADSDALIFG